MKLEQSMGGGGGGLGKGGIRGQVGTKLKVLGAPFPFPQGH